MVDELKLADLRRLWNKYGTFGGGNESCTNGNAFIWCVWVVPHKDKTHPVGEFGNYVPEGECASNIKCHSNWNTLFVGDWSKIVCYSPWLHVWLWRRYILFMKMLSQEPLDQRYACL